MALAIPRRSILLLAVLVLSSLVIVLFTRDDWSTLPHPTDWKNPFTTDSGIINPGDDGSKSTKKRPVRIAILESGGTHDEVWAAMINAFAGDPNAEITMHLKAKRYRAGDIVKNFTLPAPIVNNFHSDNFDKDIRGAPAPDILVSTTCELDVMDGHIKDTLDYLLKKEKTWLMCVIHHADRWVEGEAVKIVQRWVEAERVDFIGLSQHTVDFLVKQTIPKWNMKAPIVSHALPPVFPMQLPDFDAAAVPGLSLAMQGDYEAARRDYKGIFGHLDMIVDKATDAAHGKPEDEKVMLHLIGHGNQPKVPDNVKDHVVFNADLDYPDFYAILSKMFALLPAFASDTYYDRKASSSVPASLIAGAPIVAKQKLLDSYSYLPADAVWLLHEGEDELDVIARVMGNREEYAKKRALVQKACKDIAEQNRVNTKKWVKEAMDKAAAKR